MNTKESSVVLKEKFKMTDSQKKMWPILILGIFFEGFDDAALNFVLPYITKEFHLTTEIVGYALSLVGIGALWAFFIVRMADTVGRRPIFLGCVYLYSICSLLTVFAPNIYTIIAVQLLARVFLIGCWSVGYTILAEEFSTENLGKVSGMYQMTAVLGALTIALLLPLVLKLGFTWRALYLIGALPLIPAVIFRKNLKETQAFQELQEQKKAGIKQPKEDFFAVWRKPHTKYVLVMALVWLFMYFGIKGSLNFLTMRLVMELSWTPSMVSITILSQTLAGMVIINLNGRLLDKLGRKGAALVIITVGVVATIVQFNAQNFYTVIIFGMIAAGFVNSFLIVASTLTNELFPTELRANATAWSNNIIGRLGQILVPSMIGLLAVSMSIGHAVSIAMLMPLISLMFILVFLPETKKWNNGLVSRK
ncbi:MFS transporter [Desulfosporosinus fructosivorans]|uniref:MFS transporter n=1 Tax=Desulfosporosinus fructosivorans TaxID=2018669 RepID=A0A4Z0QZ31_9FIRM|nr:MFS transporter [Desulfosporosinus fructosivorans]TGE35203.1 MFS transporter [Desulfosporosinus fructosivorans]